MRGCDKIVQAENSDNDVEKKQLLSPSLQNVGDRIVRISNLAGKFEFKSMSSLSAGGEWFGAQKTFFFFAYAGLQMQHWFKQSEWRMEPSDCMTNITEHEHGRHATRPNPPQQHDITVFFYSNQRASESRVVQRVHTAAAYCPLVTESWPWGGWGRERGANDKLKTQGHKTTFEDKYATNP